MSSKKSLSSLLATGDDHGVSELLRQVAERSSLNEDEKKEVSAMVRRVEEHAARGTPMGKFKNKLAHNIDTINSVVKGSATDDGGDNDHDSHRSSFTETSAAATNAMNKLGKDIFQKLSKNPLTTANGDPKDPTSPMSPTATVSAKLEARRVEMKKAFERSSQSGKDLFQNFTRNFEKSLKSLEDSLMPQHHEAPTAEYDTNSAEYKMDVNAISLLKEIFPEATTEELIQMHFEHIHAQQRHNKTS